MLAAANSQPHEGGCVRGMKIDYSGMLKIVYFNRVENVEDVEGGACVASNGRGGSPLPPARY